MQSGGWVFGVEATLAAANIRATDPACGVGTGPLPCTTPLVTVGAGFLQTRETRIRSLYTLTGQLGHAWDRTLLYVKGGWAGANLDLQNSETFNGANVCTPGSGFNSCAGVRRWAGGGTVGTGIEYSVTQNVSVGAEYDYMRLRANDVIVTSVTGNVSTFGSIRQDVHQVVGRVNYRFGGPVVAKY